MRTREAGDGSLLGEIIGRPVSVLIAALGAVVLGLFSLWRLPVSLLPTLERPRLEITLRDVERSREELEIQAVLPLERRLLTLPGVLEVISVVDDGEATLVLDTEWQTDVDRLRIDVERRLAGDATAGLDQLSVDVMAGDDRPILRLAVEGPSAARRTAFADKVLVPELGRLTGAGRLRLVGGADLRPVVTPRPADLAAHGLVAADLARRLGELGRDLPLGRLRQGGQLRPLVLREEVRGLEALRAVVVSGGGLRLAEVAEVTLDEVPRGGVARVNGRPATVVELYRAPGANAVRLAREARGAVQRLARRAAPLELGVAFDGSREVVDSLLQLAQAGLLGLGLGTLVLRALLGSWRPTLALAVVVPVSVVAAMSAFLLAGVSLDLVSLAGLALAAGMLVDNSVVVLEAISSARERKVGAADGAGEPVDPVVAGSRQIAMALVASFLTTAVVFLPLVYLRGLARAFFGVQAFAIVSTLAISLVLSVTLTPVLSRLSGVAHSRSEGRQPGRRLYLRLLEAGLRRPMPWLLLTALLLAGVVLVAAKLPRELVPAAASRVLVAELRMPTGTSQAEATRRILTLEQQLGSALESAEARGAGEEAAGPAAESVDWSILQRAEETVAVGTAGGAEPELEALARVSITFPSAARLEEAEAAVRRAVSEVPGVEARLLRRPSAVAAAIERTANRLEVEVSAATPQRLDELRARTVSALEARGWEVEARRLDSGEQPLEARPAWWLRWDPVRLAKLETDAGVLAEQLRAGLESRAVGRASIEGAEGDIQLAARPGELERIGVRVATGSPQAPRVVPLGALATVEPGRQRAPAERRNGRPTSRLLISGTGDSAQLERDLSQVPRPSDADVRLAGQTRELRRSFGQLQLALSLALVLVFLTVAALYESLTLPLVVMVTVPTASAGAFLALAAAGQSFNVMSFLGLILLTGIVVNNAIVLLHRAEQHRVAGADVGLAIRWAAGERYRPILMTTLTTLLGMIPLAALGGEGVELRRALAVSVAGGLVTSWIAALLVVPLLYRMAMGRQREATPRA